MTNETELDRVDLLLPCPFCGREARYSFEYRHHCIGCPSAFAKPNTPKQDRCKLRPCIVGDDFNELKRHWNKRSQLFQPATERKEGE